MIELKRRSEAEALRYVLQKIAEFPYVGEKAAQQMQLMAKGALTLAAAPAGEELEVPLPPWIGGEDREAS